MRSELNLGWMLYTALATQSLLNEGTVLQLPVGGFLVAVAANAFAQLAFSQNGNELEIGPVPPTSASDVNAVAENVGAAIAGNALARDYLDDHFASHGTDGVAEKLAAHMLSDQDLVWRHPRDPLESIVRIARAVAAANHAE